MLIAAAAKEDRGAFARLYQTSAGKLFSVCLSILGSRTLAEEALQDAYVNVGGTPAPSIRRRARR